MIVSDNIDMLSTMYPCKADKVVNRVYDVMPYSTIYGYVIDGKVEFENGNVAFKGQYFCFWAGEDSKISVSGEATVFTRLGFMGQNMIGGPIEKTGRLVYIDTCSDSLLVYPPRMGDPSLNLLYFPKKVDQSFHIHPSIRLGVVVKGSGKAWIKNNDGDNMIDLVEGVMFCIEERETHRFSTENDSMIVIAFHPDGDWGPTDHNHTMLNRTYLIEK